MPDKSDATPIKKAPARKRPAKKPALSDPAPPPTIHPTSIEVVKSDGVWRVIEHFNTGKATQIVKSKRQKEAHSFARGLAVGLGITAERSGRSLELIIKNRKGQITQKDSFGVDPADIKG